MSYLITNHTQNDAQGIFFSFNTILMKSFFLEQTAVNEEAVPAEGEVQAEVETDPAQVALVIAKRQAPEMPTDCMVYRYGSLATSVEVVRKSMQLL